MLQIFLGSDTSCCDLLRPGLPRIPIPRTQVNKAAARVWAGLECLCGATLRPIGNLGNGTEPRLGPPRPLSCLVALRRRLLGELLDPSSGDGFGGGLGLPGYAATLPSSLGIRAAPR